MLNILLFLFLGVFPSCSKDSVPEPAPSQPTTNVRVQYGTPFNQVPDPQDAIIYQVNMRVFSSTRNFQGVINRLDQIKALGANVVYLMPIYPVGAVNSVNSPYCIRDYASINASFGTLDDLRQLVDAAHERGMAVMLDWVANHTAWDHPWVKQHKSWYVSDTSGNLTSPNGWTDVVQLNFTKQDMRAEMIGTMMDWVYKANIDGFRCDYADGPPVDFWKQALDSLKSISTHKLLMLSESGRSSNYTAGFNYNFGFGFFDQLKKTFVNNQSAKLLEGFNTSDYVSASANQYMIRYTTNHDVNSSDGTPLELFGGKTGSMAAFVVAAYMKSVPMIYNGQEVATNYRLMFPFTGPVIDWSVNADVTTEYTNVIAFRKSSDAIKQGIVAPYSSIDVCAFTKTYGNEKVLVLVNMRNATKTFTLPAALQNTTWNDVFTTPQSSVTLGTTIDLAPYQYRVFQVK